MPSIEKIRVGETEYNIADSKNIAPVEMSSTSANAYAVGDMLIYNGQLYDVISAIAVGNTLTVGTNIQASKVSAKIKEINTQLQYKYRHKYAISAMVDISNYNTDNNRYTCPSDGYVELRSNTGSFGLILYQEDNRRTACYSQTANMITPVYVRYGQVLRVSLTGNAEARFIPLGV